MRRQMVLFSMRGKPVRTTIALDDELIKMAQEYRGLVEKSALMREALKALIEREAARRLAALGGASPSMASIPRRRSKVINSCRYVGMGRSLPQARRRTLPTAATEQHLHSPVYCHRTCSW